MLKPLRGKSLAVVRDLFTVFGEVTHRVRGVLEDSREGYRGVEVQLNDCGVGLWDLAEDYTST